MRVPLREALQASQQAEADLRARERRLHVSLEAVNVGAWDWNIRTGEVRWSDNLQRIHGEPEGKFLGTFEGFLDCVHPDDRPHVLDAIQRALTGGAAYEVEYRSVLPDGSIRWFEGRGHVICDEAGKPAWMSGICMDATENHRLQDQLRQTQRLESLGILAGGIAHDFNNLLVGIMGNTSLALDSLPPLEPAVAKLQEVIDACERAAQLTRRLLAYAGKEGHTRTGGNLSVLVRELGSLVRASIPKLVTLSFDLQEDLPQVLADETQIQQVLMNLVINAAESIPADTPGTVTVTTRRRAVLPDDLHFAVIPVERPGDEFVALSVRDTGSGMDAATQARIFDPFFTTKIAGCGLGLSAVLGIVKGHGGSIILQSAPGAGTCFTLLLPIAHGIPKTEAADTVRPLPTGTGTILVVDDEAAVREMARAALETGGYSVILAGDGSQAIHRIQEHPAIRAVLLDFAMPVMGGDLAALRIRALRPELPILLSSGYTERHALQTPSEMAVSAFLQKPYDARRLLEKLADVLHLQPS